MSDIKWLINAIAIFWREKSMAKIVFFLVESDKLYKTWRLSKKKRYGEHNGYILAGKTQ